MRKKLNIISILICILFTSIVFSSCENNINEGGNRNISLTEFTYEGHDYLFAYSRSGYAGGGGVVHLESCLKCNVEKEK